MDHAGQDHNYEPGQDPMQLAVQGGGRQARRGIDVMSLSEGRT